MDKIKAFAGEVIRPELVRLILSKPVSGAPFEKIRLHPVLLRGEVVYQAEQYTKTQVFHRNLSEEEAKAFLEEMLSSYRACTAETASHAYNVLVGKRGTVTVKKTAAPSGTAGKPSPAEAGGAEGSALPARILPPSSQNRRKNYLLQEGTPVPFLVDLGVMTAEGKVVAARYDKFRQINRFLEFIDDILPELPSGRPLRILDFGCGKSYLTFAVYYYLHELKGRDVHITGLDLKEDVIRRCSALAVKYGYDGLEFLCGDVAFYDGCDEIDMMITLHACDTATDYALARAVAWKARVILSVPCCQHELNKQIENELLKPVLSYGIIKERMSALMTDALRAELLEGQGYRTQLLEFIDMEHTPKNVLIRAVRKGKPADNQAQIDAILESFHLSPALYRLLQEKAEADSPIQKNRHD